MDSTRTIKVTEVAYWLLRLYTSLTHSISGQSVSFDDGWTVALEVRSMASKGFLACNPFREVCCSNSTAEHSDAPWRQQMQTQQTHSR